MNRRRKRKNNRCDVDKKVLHAQKIAAYLADRIMMHVAGIYTRHIIGKETWVDVMNRKCMIVGDLSDLCRFFIKKFSPYIIGIKKVRMTELEGKYYVHVQSENGQWGKARLSAQ
jgi:hypothetical protein